MKTVLILTIARSGSSLLSGILHRLGVNMGDENDMYFGKHLNKYGSYENQEFIAFSMNILFDVKILLKYPNRLTNYEDEMKQAAEKYRLKFRGLIQKYSKEPIWGFKEASLIYYLPYLLDEIINPKYIHLIRNYESTAKSLCDTLSRKNWKPEMRERLPFLTIKKRIKLFFRLIKLYFTDNKNKNPKYFLKIVIDAHNKIKNFLKDRDHLIIQLEDLTTNPLMMINQIIAHLEISPSKKQIEDALSFIHPELLIQ